MDHIELARIKARRGFVESATGGFVRSSDWVAPKPRRLREAPPGPQSYPVQTYAILSWSARIGLALRVGWCLLTKGSREAALRIIISPAEDSQNG